MRTWILGLGLGIVLGGAQAARAGEAPPLLRGESLLRARAAARAPVTAHVLDEKQEALRRARAAFRDDVRASSAAVAATPAWTSVGPSISHGGSPDPQDADAGRVVSIVIDPTDPTILYVATAGGGVWKCTNADPANDDWIWTPLTDELGAASADGSIAPGALAMSASDHQTLYLAMGDPYITGPVSRGFYVTHDAGATWTPGGSLGNSTHVRDMLTTAPAGGPDVVLVTSDTGLWRSADGGSTFSQISLPVGGFEGWSLRALSTTGMVMSVQTSSEDGLLWWSDDAGATWSPATVSGAPGAPGRIRLDTAPGASSVDVRGVYEDLSSNAESAALGILKSVDGGKTYSFVSAPVGTGSLFQGEAQDGTEASYALLIALDPSDPTKMFAGTNFAFYRSVDDGVSWEQLTEWYGSGHAYMHADVHASAWSGGQLYVGNDGGLAIFRDPYRTPVPVVTDPTFLDNRHNKGLATDLLYTVGSTDAPTPSNAPDMMTAGAQDNGILVRVSGSTWNQPTTGDGFGTVIHAVDPTQILASVYAGYFFKSTNAGGTFTYSVNGLPLNDEGFATHLVPAWADATGNTLLHNSYYHVYRSTDFGDNWSAIGESGIPGSAVLLAIAASHRSAGTIAVSAANHHGYITRNGGGSWTAFGALPNAGSLYPGYDDATNLWIDTRDDSILYVTSESLLTTKSHLWRSTDGGATFTAIDAAGSGFPEGLPVYAVQNDPRSSQVLYAGTELGVYRSEDAGATWTRYGTGLPLVGVRALWLAADASRIRAATYGRAMWEAPLADLPAAPSKKKRGCSCSLRGKPAESVPNGALLAGGLALAAIVLRRRNR